MNRHRWVFHVTVGPAQAAPRGPWPRESTRYLEEFKPLAERYRRRNFIAVSLFLGYLLGGIGVMHFDMPNVLRLWLVGAIATGLILSCLIFVFRGRLICPACGKRLKPARGQYCPQCGSDQFEHGSHKRGPLFGTYAYCPSCDGKIAEEDSDSARSYWIRGCTHCGVMLDENGL